MKIAVIGMGSVGGTLGRRFAELGHSVTFGAQNPSDAAAKALVAGIRGDARVATVTLAAADAEIVVLATPYDANVDVIVAAGDLKGKIIIDVTNPVARDLSGLVVGSGTSGAEQVAALAHGARVYKTLHQTGWQNMANPVYPAGKPVMFVAGDEPAGKATVLALVEALGFEAIDAGDLSIARLLEPYAMLWIHVMMARRESAHQFALGLMRRDA
jgi:8-hydroxy-5-deazaflavin:NADPH oxidoreductase